MKVLIRKTVRLEPFPNGLPIPVSSELMQHLGNPSLLVSHTGGAREGRGESKAMKKAVLLALVIFLWIFPLICPMAKDLEIKGNRLISQRPPFTVTIPPNLRLIHSFSHENPGESSLTRVFFYVKDRGRRAEEMFILQISDKTNPQASPMTAPSLKPYSEKRMYQKEKMKKGDLEIEHLTQLMAWNPDATSLQPLIQKGIVIPHHWALQGQFQFNYLGEHVVLVRYSRDVNSFGLNVSQEGKEWEKKNLSGNQKKVYEIFQKGFIEMIHSIQINSE